MVAQRGKDLLLKIDSLSNGNFHTIAGLRAKRLAFNAETVDASDSQSQGRWRELLAGAGLRRASVSGSGLFKDQASDALMHSTFFDEAIVPWQIIIPEFGTLQGSFQIVSLEYSGQHDGEVSFELSLESAGPIQWVAL